jgi:DNA-binding MurR/RpiR family transcriptional regulator
VCPRSASALGPDRVLVIASHSGTMTDALEVATEVADARLDVVDLLSTLEAA